MKRIPPTITVLLCLLLACSLCRPQIVRTTTECLPPCECVCPTATPTPAPTATPGGTTFVIGHITDAHVGASYINKVRLAAIVSDMPANIILDSGDCTETGSSSQWADYATAMSGANIPWKAAPGNHDSNFPYPANWIWDVGGYRIIGFDYRAPNWAWLDQQTQTSLPIVLVYHHANDAAMQAWLSSHGVLLLLSGHLHINQVYTNDETTIVVTARAGLGNHALVTLQGGAVTVTWRNPY